MQTPQRIATLTNLAYPIGGLIALWDGGPAAWPFFLAMCALGGGSAYFHAVERRPYETRRRGRLADRFGMLCVFGTLLALSFGLTAPAVYLAVWGLSAAILTRISGLSHYVVGALAAISVLAVALRGEPAWAGVIGVLYGLALWVWNLDGPSSWVHGAWHILSSCAILAVYASLATLL